MATIPTVPGTKVAAAPIGAAPLDAGALMAPGKAMASMGAALNDASRVTEEFALKKRAAINATDLIDAKMQMEQAESDYVLNLDKNPDEETWTSGFQKVAEATKAKILSNPQMAPDVKAKLSNEFTEWSTRGAISIANQADRRTVQRQKVKMETVSNYLVENGRLDEGLSVLDSAEKAGLLFPEQKVKMQMQLTQKYDFSQANKSINEDPFTAVDKLAEKDKQGNWSNFTNVDENTREALKVEALRRTSAVRAETVQDLVQRRNNGEILKPMELQSLVDQRKLKPTEMKWIMQEQGRSSNNPEVNVAFAKTLSAVDHYDPSADPTNEQYATLFAQSVQFSPQYRDEIQKRLDKRKNPTGTDHLTKDAKGYIDDLLRGGFLGNVAMNPDEKGKPLNPKEYVQAYGKTVELRQALDSFMRENPTATPVEQRDFINTKIRGQKSVSAALPILNAISGRASPSSSVKSISSKAEFDALPSGASFMYNGKVGTKK